MRKNKCLPNFLGIGAQKSGTTWLYQNLRRHPDLWLPPIKELHYFDRAPIYPSSSRLASERLSSRLFGKKSQDLEARKYLKSQLYNILRQSNSQQLRWKYRYLFGKYDDDWYASLFKEGSHKIRGEITPSYSVLESRDVEHIHELMPEVKIIFIIRNPIDRTWSHLRFHNNRFKIKELQTMAEFKKFVNSPGVILKGDYARTINIWRSYFPENQFFIGFYDDIKDNPTDFLLRVLEFLGVETSKKQVGGDLSKRVYASPKQEFPEEFKRYLAKKYFQQIKQLSEMLGEHATEWLEQIAENT